MIKKIVIVLFMLMSINIFTNKGYSQNKPYIKFSPMYNSVPKDADFILVLRSLKDFSKNIGMDKLRKMIQKEKLPSKQADFFVKMISLIFDSKSGLAQNKNIVLYLKLIGDKENKKALFGMVVPKSGNGLKRSIRKLIREKLPEFRQKSFTGMKSFYKGDNHIIVSGSNKYVSLIWSTLRLDKKQLIKYGQRKFVNMSYDREFRRIIDQKNLKNKNILWYFKSNPGLPFFVKNIFSDTNHSGRVVTAMDYSGKDLKIVQYSMVQIFRSTTAANTQKLIFSIPEKPLAWINVDIRAGDISKILEHKMGAKYQMGLRMLKSRYRIDLQSDFFDLLNKELSMAMFANKQNSRQLNFLVYVGVTDQKRVEKTLNALFQSSIMGPRVKLIKKDGHWILKLSGKNFYIGFKNSRLLIAYGADIFSRAISGNRDDGFLSKMSNLKLKESFLQRSNIFYLGIKRTMLSLLRVYRFMMVPLMMKQYHWIINLMKRMDYMTVFTQQSGRVIHTHTLVKTSFQKPFFKNILIPLLRYLLIKQSVPANNFKRKYPNKTEVRSSSSIEKEKQENEELKDPRFRKERESRFNRNHKNNLEGRFQ